METRERWLNDPKTGALEARFNVSHPSPTKFNFSQPNHSPPQDQKSAPQSNNLPQPNQAPLTEQKYNHSFSNTEQKFTEQKLQQDLPLIMEDSDDEEHLWSLL